jgi:hypothetical protein
VLLGADPAAPGLIEVAPWGEWEGEWTAVSSADLAVGRPLEIVASPAATDAR